MRGWVLSLLLIFICNPTAQAGYVELGFAGNYRKLYLPSETSREYYDSTVACTASLAYYFAEMAAVELNTTRGRSERHVPSSLIDTKTTYDFTLVGLDLIPSFAERNAPFVPYIKAGVAHFVNKDVTYEFRDNVNPLNNRMERVNLGSAYVPSLGFGMRLRITQAIALKVGLEAWTSDSLETDPRWDIAGRAGVSWFF